MKRKIYQVDAFTSNPYSGNPVKDKGTLLLSCFYMWDIIDQSDSHASKRQDKLERKAAPASTMSC